MEYFRLRKHLWCVCMCLFALIKRDAVSSCNIFRASHSSEELLSLRVASFFFFLIQFQEEKYLTVESYSLKQHLSQLTIHFQLFVFSEMKVDLIVGQTDTWFFVNHHCLYLWYENLKSYNNFDFLCILFILSVIFFPVHWNVLLILCLKTSLWTVGWLTLSHTLVSAAKPKINFSDLYSM